MKMKLLQFICLVVGVGLLSFGAGLYSGRMGGGKAEAPLASQKVIPPEPAAITPLPEEQAPAAQDAQLEQERQAPPPAALAQPKVIDLPKIAEQKIEKKPIPKPEPTPVYRVRAPKESAPEPPILEGSYLGDQSPSLDEKEAGRSLGPRYVVQVISSPSRTDAIAARNKIMGAGFPAGIFEADLGAKGKWYRIYVGPYDNEFEAKAALDSVQEVSGYTSSFVKALE